MTFSEAARIMMNKNSIIEPLTITSNGTYTASGGIDGYNPVYVKVPDRYDEGYQNGYQDGYSDAEKIYGDLIDHEKGDLPSVTDDMGNVINNAIEIPNDDDLTKYIAATRFTGNGDGATITGIGGDTDFKIYRDEEALGTSGMWSVQLKIKMRNRTTGIESIVGSTSAVTVANPEDVKISIRSFGFMYNYGRVTVGLDYSIPSTGYQRSDSIQQAYATRVGGTKFIGTGTENEWIYS